MNWFKFYKSATLNLQIEGLWNKLLKSTFQPIKVFVIITGFANVHIFSLQNFDLVKSGMVNLAKQIENARFFGVHAIVAVNRFP